MRRLLSKQFVNILFMVLVVAAALTIYLLSRSQDASRETSAASESAPPAAETADALSSSPEPVFSGVPESVFVAHLETSELYKAEQSASDARVWTLITGETASVCAELNYTVERGALSSFTLTFPLPSTYNAKSKSAIERFLASKGEALTAAQSDAAVTFLTDLMPACDADDALSASSVRAWAEKAVQIEGATGSFDEREGDFYFLAYRTTRENADALVCEFYIEP